MVCDKAEILQLEQLHSVQLYIGQIVIDFCRQDSSAVNGALLRNYFENVEAQMAVELMM